MSVGLVAGLGVGKRQGVYLKGTGATLGSRGVRTGRDRDQDKKDQHSCYNFTHNKPPMHFSFLQ